MPYVLGAAVGLIFGGIIGWIKNHFVWKKYLHRRAYDFVDNEARALYSRMFISNGINFATLLIAFLLRNLLPFNWIAFFISTALMLTIMNKFLARSSRLERKEA